jgi:hypothetical protein
MLRSIAQLRAIIMLNVVEASIAALLLESRIHVSAFIITFRYLCD